MSAALAPQILVGSIDAYSPNLVNFGHGSRDTTRRHASVLHWCTF